ncbi:hypothetical protein [Mucilaginibacter phyllosphaerae]|uniref:EcsC family protein n=1 Tax=Mucilaginibacter phyllosphaerae TaxID=1812349 RepID=A0A4Y8AES3_9SPHI|nr:hypothetical protein [Mucilaginibacter phyllosphaerae]MBB3970236.1 hypothetical protein [Mucilaginibacter phyllosphaerae]TEW66615.1 hypothetical protein E2R65_09330 [Mucilaginibacter phyllosphaerae]GGH10697.1 hypothetical protein GCM10007352_16620 [Mucilaginibacter phyllosphaerae]
MILPFKKKRIDIKKFADRLSTDGFKQIFDHIDQLSIKRSVDRMGLDKFINQCAYVAAGSGAIAGSGGIMTMLIGMPIDFVNLITQQFRVTMAIMYYTKGNYKISFDEFMKLVATSFKVEAGVAVTKTMMEGIAEKLLLAFGVRAAERLVPVVGAVIGGTTNYIFVKRMAQQIKELKGANKTVIIPIN